MGLKRNEGITYVKGRKPLTKIGVLWKYSRLHRQIRADAQFGAHRAPEMRSPPITLIK